MTPTANDAFIAACLETDRLLGKLKALRDDHYGVDGEKGANWADHGSVEYLNQKLREAVSFMSGGEEH